VCDLLCANLTVLLVVSCAMSTLDQCLAMVVDVHRSDAVTSFTCCCYSAAALLWVFVISKGHSHCSDRIACLVALLYGACCASMSAEAVRQHDYMCSSPFYFI
jgi:hypothetical protein